MNHTSSSQQSVTDQAIPGAMPAQKAVRFPAWQRALQKAELFVGKGLHYHFIYASWRAGRTLSRWQRPAALTGAHALAAKLRKDLPDLAWVQDAVGCEDKLGLQEAIAHHFRTRHAPHFFFTADQIPATVALVEQIDPTGRDNTLREADQICQNSFCFRHAEPVIFSGAVDWKHTPHGNIDWMWDLNRHTYFESLGRAYWYTGQEKYVAKFAELITDWLAQNPPNIAHPSWSSVFEVALRINTWLWALHLFQHSPACDDATLTALLAGLWSHGHFLDTHIELHAQNNHLLLEAKSLAMLGILLPEFNEAARWRRRGLSLFYRELQEQVCPDGVHGERATLYHRIIMGEFIELVVLAENNAITLPQEITQILPKMATYALWLIKPDGLPPLLGDSSLEDVHLRFSGTRGVPLLIRDYPFRAAAPPPREAELWLMGPQRVRDYQAAEAQPVEIGSRAFAQGGYFIMRSGRTAAASYAVFDCGPFGYHRDATHGHADALSLELYAQGQTWLVDPGVYSTHLGWTWRRFFRGSRAHNTVVIDGQDQSRLLDGRRVYRPAQATLQQWVSNDTFDYVAGSHDGYTHLTNPITHQRQIFFVKPDYWVVVDQLYGTGEHCFDLYFHLWPDLDIEQDDNSQSVRVTNGHGASLQIVPIDDTLSSLTVLEGIGEDAAEPVQGWVALYSGEKRPAPVLRYRRLGPAPTVFCTLIYAQPAMTPKRAIHATQLVVTNEPALHADNVNRPTCVALRLDDGEHVDHLLMALDTSQTSKHFDDFTTDAELLYIRQHKSGGQLLACEMHDGSNVSYEAQPFPTMPRHAPQGQNQPLAAEHQP